MTTLLQTIVDNACKICGAKAAAVYLVNDLQEREAMDLKATCGDDSLFVDRPKVGSPEYTALLQSQTEDTEDGGICQAMVPMGGGENEMDVGVLVVKQKEKGNCFSEEDASLLELYCQQVTLIS